MITVTYTSIDRVRIVRKFKTLKGARGFAQKWVGKNPDTCGGYAVCDYGVGKITVVGCALRELFGDEHEPKAVEPEDTDYFWQDYVAIENEKVVQGKAYCAEQDRLYHLSDRPRVADDDIPF